MLTSAKRWLCPGFSILAVLTIAVGLGASAAIFALVNTLFLLALHDQRTMDVVRAERLEQGRVGTFVTLTFAAAGLVAAAVPALRAD